MPDEHGVPRPGVLVATPDGAPTPLGEVGSQQLLLGGARRDGSPVLVGLTRVLAGQCSELIAHTVDEVAYVVDGTGAMVTDRGRHPFAVGDAILISAGSWHAIEAADTDVSMLYAFPCPDVPPTRRWEEVR